MDMTCISFLDCFSVLRSSVHLVGRDNDSTKNMSAYVGLVFTKCMKSTQN